MSEDPSKADLLAQNDADANSVESQIDWEHLHQLSDGNTAFELELLKIFTEDAYVHLASVKTAVAAEDFESIEQEAHHIKGSSANVGIKIIQALAAQLEQQARDRQSQGAVELLVEVEKHLHGLKTYIHAI